MRRSTTIPTGCSPERSCSKPGATTSSRWGTTRRRWRGPGDQVRPAALGTAHVGAGRTLVALQRIDEAKQHASIAAALLERWGGTRVEELAVLQRRLGGGEPVEGPAELTPREREVVTLLAEGLTNGELATRLFISPKTASVHVSNILAKLSMTSRAEIAAYSVRSGLADA